MSERQVEQRTMCGHCEYEEGDGDIIEQCSGCKAKDAVRRERAEASRGKHG